MDVTMEVVEYPDRGREFVMAEGPTQPLVPILSKRHEAPPLPRRGSIFGFPLRNTSDQNKTVTSGSTVDTYPPYNENGALIRPKDHEYQVFRHEADPQYAAYTPPYYYGKSKITMAYTHNLEEIEFVSNKGNFDFNDPLRPSYSHIVENIRKNTLTTFSNALDRILFLRRMELLFRQVASCLLGPQLPRLPCL